MKISSLETKLQQLSPVAERKGPAAKDSTVAGEASAKVELSAAAQAAMSGLNGNFDAEKVERMQQAIKNGSFEVNPDAIADKLIANAREQLAKTYR